MRLVVSTVGLNVVVADFIDGAGLILGSWLSVGTLEGNGEMVGNSVGASDGVLVGIADFDGDSEG
jgi:hypothetical protein